MTDLQVRYMGNEIAQEKNEIEREKLAEDIRQHMVKEYQTDLENLSKYGYAKYQPATESGWNASRNAQGVTQMPFDFFRDTVGGLISSMSPLSKIR